MGKHKNKEDKSCKDKSCSTLYMLMIFIFGVVFGISTLLIMQNLIAPLIFAMGDQTAEAPPAMSQPSMAQPSMAQPSMAQPSMAQPVAPTTGGRKLFRNRY
jgi:hypothetical protein